MDTSNLSERDQNNTGVEKAIQFLENQKDELISQIGAAFKSLAWENRYVLHPRRLSEMSGEEVDRFRAYLGSLDQDAVVELGRTRAQEGLSHNALLKLFGLYTQFFVDSAGEGIPDVLKSAIGVLDGYMTAYIRGFIEKRESQILTDQEQLRIALSTALEQQRRELYIKNHAIHTSINGILIAGMDRLISYVNPAFIKMWGFTRDENVLSTPMFRLWGKEKGEEINSSLEREGGWQGEITCRRQNGTSFDVALSTSLIMDETGNPVGIMASLIDVTMRHRLESQFRQAQKMEALGQLAGGIVHDFNNLLTAISGYAQLELMDLPKDSPQYNDFLQIKTATDRGMDLTQELRIFTRQASTDMEPINPNDIIEETYNIMKRAFPPEVKIELDLDKDLRTTKANPSQIIQMIMNLCVNAGDAIQSLKRETERGDTGGARGTITITTSNIDLGWEDATRFLHAKPGRYVCLTVRDTGCGMDPQIMDRLFEPFFTTKGERRGTGLGLAVVYGIVQNHSGFIDVESKPGLGSSFKIYLPVSKGKKAEHRPLLYSPNLTVGKGTILVADDDGQVMDMVSRALEKSGYVVIPAGNGVEAMLKYKAHRDQIDLVILDMVMPQMNGRDCLYHLKEINPDVKVIIMTGYTTDGSADDLLNEGALLVIPKPFELQSFTNEVHKAVGGTIAD